MLKFVLLLGYAKIREWMETRALVLPQSKREDLAAKVDQNIRDILRANHIDPANLPPMGQTLVLNVEVSLRNSALSALDREAGKVK